MARFGATGEVIQGFRVYAGYLDIVETPELSQALLEERSHLHIVWYVNILANLTPRSNEIDESSCTVHARLCRS